MLPFDEALSQNNPMLRVEWRGIERKWVKWVGAIIHLFRGSLRSETGRLGKHSLKKVMVGFSIASVVYIKSFFNS